MRSMGLNTRMTPGPLARSSSFPRRKTTPRSYSARILIELIRYSTTIRAATRTGDNSSGISAPPDGQCQTVNIDDVHAAARVNAFGRDRPPDLPAHAQLSGVTGLDRCERFAQRANQGSRPGRGLPALRPD